MQSQREGRDVFAHQPLTNHGSAAVGELSGGVEGAQGVLGPPRERGHQGGGGEQHEGEADEGGLLAQLPHDGVAGGKLSTQGSHKAEHCKGSEAE